MANVQDRIFRTTAPVTCFDCGIETRTSSKTWREFGGARVQATVCAKGTGCKPEIRIVEDEIVDFEEDFGL